MRSLMIAAGLLTAAISVPCYGTTIEPFTSDADAAQVCGQLPSTQWTYISDTAPSAKVLTPYEEVIKWDGFIPDGNGGFYQQGGVYAEFSYHVVVQCNAYNPAQHLMDKWTKTLPGADTTEWHIVQSGDIYVCVNGVQQNGYPGPCSPYPATTFQTIYL